MSSARKRSSPTMLLVSAAAVHGPPTVTPGIRSSSSSRRAAATCDWSSSMSPKYASTLAFVPSSDVMVGVAGDGCTTRATSGSRSISRTTFATAALPSGDATGTPGSTRATTEGTADAPVAATMSSCASTAFDEGSLNPLADSPPIRLMPTPRAAAATRRETMSTLRGWASDTRAMRSSTR